MLDAVSALTRTGMRSPFNAARWPDWTRLERGDFGLALSLATGAVVVNTAGAFRLLRERSLLDLAEFTGTMFLDSAIMYVFLVAALKAVERLPLQGWRRHLTTVATGLTVAFVVGLVEYSPYWPYATPGLKFAVAFSPMALMLYSMWAVAAMALIARAWLVKSHEETLASKLLSDLRSEQVSVRRRLVEGRLKAIQARVDPEFFFDMLESVQKAYAIDSNRAEQLLDELTTFLRAALPRLRTASSTVGQECELARSFARLRALAGRGYSSLEVDIAPTAGGARFPPGVLLPLIDELLRATADADSIGLSCLAHEPTGSLLSVQLTAAAKPSVEALAAARATLVDLFGASASLATIAIGNSTRTTVQVPYELASA